MSDNIRHISGKSEPNPGQRNKLNGSDFYDMRCIFILYIFLLLAVTNSACDCRKGYEPPSTYYEHPSDDNTDREFSRLETLLEKTWQSFKGKLRKIFQ